MQWSEMQRKAIEIKGKNVLVAAAAGSGKTAVLVERIVQRIQKRECDVDEILVVTFTNAAAAEMRERIEGALQKALEKEPGNLHLQKQLVLLHAASISTLHAFCQSVIRQNFHLLDLDGRFRLGTQQEMELLQRDVLEELFEKKYEEGSEDFLAFVDAYGNAKSDEILYELILSLYAFSRSQPFPEAWLLSLSEDFSLSHTAGLAETKWMLPVSREIRRNLEACHDIVEEMIDSAGLLCCEFYLPLFQEDREILRSLEEAEKVSWSALRDAVFAVKFGRMTAPKGTEAEVKDIFSAKREQLKKRIKNLKESCFMLSEEEMLEDLRGQKNLLLTICQLTIAFGDAFATEKKKKSLADFNDLEHFALEILRDKEAVELAPSAAAKALQARYKEVMVDEYQDTNGVQEAILSLVCCKEPGNLFVVGDVKQSIYRFRLADPGLFMEKYQSYPQLPEKAARIDLAQNFRSRASVLGAVNYLFVQLMDEGAAELSYGEAEALHPGLVYPEAQDKTVSAAVEMDLICKDPDREEKISDDEEQEERQGFSLEAAYIAQRIRALKEEKLQVFDKETGSYRPLAWRDIVILLRSPRGKAGILLEALRTKDIPAYATVEEGYFQETEIQVMLSVLKVIDNPYQDIPLAAVLYSPLGGFSAAELAYVRLSATGKLFDALLSLTAPDTEAAAAIKEKAGTFLGLLRQWRDVSRRAGVPELIWKIFEDTGYYEYNGGMPGGMLRQANLRLLHDRAAEYEQTNFRGLFRFLRFIEKMQSAGTDLASARTLGEAEDVVRIMSIHKSKGLEFPVVIAGDLGKQFNLRDSRDTLLLHKKYGIGPYCIDAEASVRYPTFARIGIACQLVNETKAEELRVLYVALTRAREKLILVGSVKKIAEKAAQWCRQTDSAKVLLPEYQIAEASSYLDWICPAIARHPDGALLREQDSSARNWVCPPIDYEAKWQLQMISADEIALPKDNALAEERSYLTAALSGQNLPDSPEKDWVTQRLSWRYPDFGTREAAAKLSVTEAKRRFEMEDGQSRPLFTEYKIQHRPRFMQQTKGLQGNEYGTLLHTVMQHLDLQGTLDVEGIKLQVEKMTECQIILPEQAEYIQAAGIARFFKTTLGQRIVQAKQVERELPFSWMLPASRFYPEVRDTEEQIFMQGIADLLLIEPDGCVLVDYKTDKNGSSEELAEKYRLQMELYSEAVSSILGKKVKEKYLYAFHSGEVISL